MDFLNVKKETFYFYLLTSYLLKFVQNVVTFPELFLQQKVTFLQRVYDTGFNSKYQRCSNNIVFLKSFSWICTEKGDV